MQRSNHVDGGWNNVKSVEVVHTYTRTYARTYTIFLEIHTIFLEIFWNFNIDIYPRVNIIKNLNILLAV